MEMKFYICETCGNMIAMLKRSGVSVMCCGKKMTELEPGTTDAAVEKHVPVLCLKTSYIYRIKLVKNVQHDIIGLKIRKSQISLDFSEKWCKIVLALRGNEC